MRIDWDVPITMDDGLVLRADVYRPLGDGHYPVILSHGPYAKGLAFQEGYRDQWEKMVTEHPEVAAQSTNKYQNWEVVDPEKWVRDGYACVRVDSRGAGRSPGYVDPFSPRETRDLYDCIEWAGTQPWSSGKVGLNGISYYAMNQWHVAALEPPHLVAMCPWEGAADWYRDMTYHGGILSTFFARWFPQQVTNVQHGVGKRGPRDPNTGQPVAGPETLPEEELERNRVDLTEVVRAHRLDDDLTRARSAEWSKVTVPLLSCANWGGQGWLRASHRKLDQELSLDYRPYHTHDEVWPLTPEEIYELDVEIWPTCVSVPAGYRVALTVRGKDYEYGGEPIRVGWLEMKGCGPFLHDDPRDRPPEVFGGNVTVHTGPDHGSYVLLPIIPG